jgi:hypothetical protein
MLFTTIYIRYFHQPLFLLQLRPVLLAWTNRVSAVIRNPYAGRAMSMELQKGGYRVGEEMRSECFSNNCSPASTQTRSAIVRLLSLI